MAAMTHPTTRQIGLGGPWNGRRPSVSCRPAAPRRCSRDHLRDVRILLHLDDLLHAHVRDLRVLQPVVHCFSEHLAAISNIIILVLILKHQVHTNFLEIGIGFV